VSLHQPAGNLKKALVAHAKQQRPLPPEDAVPRRHDARRLRATGFDRPLGGSGVETTGHVNPVRRMFYRRMAMPHVGIFRQFERPLRCNWDANLIRQHLSAACWFLSDHPILRETGSCRLQTNVPVWQSGFRLGAPFSSLVSQEETFPVTGNRLSESSTRLGR